MRRALASESGSATAELAVLMPSLLLVLAMCLGGVRLAALQFVAQDAAADAARSAARGDPSGVASARVAHALPGAELAQRESEGMACSTVRAPPAFGIRVQASSCAWAGGG